MAASSSGIRAGKAFVELSLKSKLEAGLKNASKKLKAGGAAITSVGTRLFAAGSAGMALFAAATAQFAEYGNEINKAAKKTGTTTEAITELRYAAELAGVDFDTLQGSLGKMQKNIYGLAKQSPQATTAFRGLHLSMKDLKGLSPDEQFQKIAERLAEVKDPAKKSAIAMQIFGKTGRALIPMFDDLAAARAEARELGLPVNQKDADAATALHEAWSKVKATFNAVVLVIGGALAPMRTELLGTVKQYLVAAAQWIKQNKGLVVTASKVVLIITGIGAGLIALGAVISGVGTALGVMATILGVVGTAFSVIGAVIGFILSPIGLVLVAVAGLGAYFVATTNAMGTASDWLKEKFGDLGSVFGETFQGIKDALAAGDIGLAAKILWLALQVAWVRGTNIVKGVWSSMTNYLVDSISSAWASILSFGTVVFHGLSVGWIETVSFLSTAWTSFLGFFKSAWATTQNWIGKAWLHLQSLWDDTLDVEKVSKMLDDDLQQQLNNIDAVTKAKLAAAEKDRKAQLDAEDATNQGALAAIEADYQKKKAARDAERAAGDQDAQAADDRLAAARKEWQDAIAKAKKEKDDKDEGDKPKAPAPAKKPQLGDLSDAVGSISRGTFNARAVQGLSVSLFERMQGALDEIADNTAPLKDADGIEIG